MDSTSPAPPPPVDPDAGISEVEWAAALDAAAPELTGEWQPTQAAQVLLEADDLDDEAEPDDGVLPSVWVNLLAELAADLAEYTSGEVGAIDEAELAEWLMAWFAEFGPEPDDG